MAFIIHLVTREGELCKARRLEDLTATRELVRAFPEAKVLVVSRHDDERLRAAAHAAGARGYVLK